MGVGVPPLPGPPRFPFYRLSTIGWANPLLRQTLPLLAPQMPQELLVDLSSVEFLDSFGLTYLAACLDRCSGQEGITKILVRPPSRANVHTYLQNAGFYESIGLGDQFRPRQPDRNRVDLVHIRELEPLFIDGLLNFLESLQPFAPGLKPSMRMALLELVQNFAEHSGSVTGAWVSGHKYRNRITLCLLDLGKGIPASLRGVDRYRRMRSDPHLIELATEAGVSAVATNRGRGLDVIRRFVRVNGGTMTIISGKGRVRFRPDRRAKRDKIDGVFPGTAVFLSLVPTQRGLYVLGDEDNGNETY
jgi:hypothetical protein